MKRLLSMLLVFVMVFSVIPHSVFAADAEAVPPAVVTEEPAEISVPEETVPPKKAPTGRASDEPLVIHYFLASPGNITNPNGSYINYYGPDKSLSWWPESYAIDNIQSLDAWDQIFTQQGIRNVYDESIVTQYVASWPAGYNATTFKDFGSVRINGTTYYDTDYEIKWVSVMCRNNASSSWGLRCNQSSFQGDHIHIDGLLVEKIQPGEMKVFKAIPEAAAAETTFRFTLQKMLQSNLTSPPSSADAVDTAFAPMTLTASIPAGQKEAQITGGSEISFGYYKLTENSSSAWQMDGIALTDSRGNTTTNKNSDALYICIAPNGTVQYSLEPSGPYTVMNYVAIQNERKDVSVTYQWRVYDLSGTVSEDLPAGLGSNGLPASVTGLKIGSDYSYDTNYVQGTSYHDYENGLLYTFHGWDTYSHSSAFNVDPTAAGYTALDDGDAVAGNNKAVLMNADTWINGYWTVSKLSAAEAYLLLHKDVVVASGDAAYVNNYLHNIGEMYISIDPGIDKDGDGVSLVVVDYPGSVAEGGYRIDVYQYETPFVFTEHQADIPGYTRAVDITVSGSNLTLTGKNGDRATVAIAEEYDPAQAPYNLGTVTYTNTYTKNIGTPVTEYPVLTLVKRATDTGLLQAGAVFTLYRDSSCTQPVATYTTGDGGIREIDFATLLSGTEGAQTFYLKETAAPDGYLLDSTVYTLTLTPAQTEELRNNRFVTVTTYTLDIAIPAGSIAEPIQSTDSDLNFSLNIFNRPILGEISVTKAATGLSEADQQLLEVTVTIHGPVTRKASGQITDLGEEYTLILNSENDWTFLLNQLPLGEYLIHENLASVHGYTWDKEKVSYGTLETEEYNGITSGVFQIAADSTQLALTITNTYHKWESAGFEIYKIDPSGLHLSGAAFQLFSDEACTVKVTDPSITTSAVTGANGIAWFSGYTVPADDADGIMTYYLRETKAPDGHYLSATVYRVDIQAVAGNDGTVSYEPKISVKGSNGWVEAPEFSKTSDSLTVVNTPVKGQITLTKQMLGAPNDLTSVTFYVSGPNGYARTVMLTKAGSWTATLNDLPLGQYTIIEQNADVPGYKLITAYEVDGVKTDDKATVVLKEASPGQTAEGTVFAGTTQITNIYTRNEEVFEVPTSLTVKKVGENDQPLAGAVFTLNQLDSDGKTVLSSASFTTGADGILTFDLLYGSIQNGQITDGTYVLSETKAPEGYEPIDNTWTVTVREDDGQIRWTLNENKNIFEGFWDWIVGNVSPGTFEGGVLTVQNLRKTGSLTIHKEVVDPEGLYANAEYTFTLDCSDNAFDKTFTLKAGESCTLENIPWGTTYTLTEDTSDAAFTAHITDGGKGKIWAEETAITVTNTYAYSTHNEPLSLVKVDADDNTYVIPGAGFTLYADEARTEKVGEEVFSDENGRLALPIDKTGTYYLEETTTPVRYHSNDKIYVVTAQEKPVVLNPGTADAVTQLQMHIRISGLTGTTENQIDYTYAIENTVIKPLTVGVEKIWQDGGYHARPQSLDVTLYRDGEAFETVTLNAKNSWRYVWENLTDEYTWRVDEPEVPDGYEKSVVNNSTLWTITNTRTPNPVEISVNKVWYGAGVTHPTSVSITLYRNGESYETVTLSAANNWRYTWENLTDEALWTVDEPSVPSGYTKSVRQDGYNFTVVNTHVDNPKTGDMTNLLGMGTMTTIGAAGFGISLLALLPSRKKKDEEDEQ